MDYHVHSIHSFDGHQLMDELCMTMLSKGVEEFCLTEHIEPGHPDPDVDIPPIWDVWMEDIHQMRQKYPQLTIRAGVEIGDNSIYRKAVEKKLRELALDYHLLSLHLVNGVDCYDVEKYYTGKSRAKAYRDYLEAKAESVMAWHDFDCVAHIGYVSRYAPYDASEKPIRYADAPDAIDAIFRKMIQEGKCLEVNTSGMISTGEPFPSYELIKRYIALGGELFTFGSDAHRTERDGEGIEDAKAMVRSLGGKYQAGFCKRKMTVYAL